jgi:MFS family permease
MADRYGVRLPTQITFGVILVAIVGTILTVQSVWGLYIFGTLGIGAAWALSTLLPGMVTIASEPEMHGRVFGGLHTVWTIAMMLGTLLAGQLLEIDFRLPFMVVGVLNVIALFLTVPFFRPPVPEPATV